MKILLAVDGSEYTKRMLAYLAAHDELLGKRGDYVAVTVVPSITQHALKFLEQRVVEDYYRDEAEAVLRPVQAFADMQGWTLRTLQTHGQAAAAITKVVADEKPDMVVMGSHGHSALGNLVMGSVTTAVLAHCPVPVLLIR